ncbi:MAG: energy transducer TonB [Pseudomonadota bacterium]
MTAAYSAYNASTRPPRISRNAAIAGSVVLFHVALLWAFQAGLVRRVAEIIVPVEVLSDIVTPPEPVKPPPPAPKPPPAPPTPRPKAPSPPPPPRPQAIADPAPAPNAPTGVTTPQPPPPPIAAPVAVEAPPPAPPAPAKVTLPSTDADYLQNPKPAYPAISKRLGEQGKVVVRVLIGADGLPQTATVQKSSGFDRLDRAATDTVMRWRFVPGKRNGVAEAMSFNVPINFVLE